MKRKINPFTYTYASDFLNYRENNIIYAAYFFPTFIYMIIDGIKYTSNLEWNTWYIYFVLFLFNAIITIIYIYLSYNKKMIKSYLKRKYFIMLLGIPSTTSLSFLTFLSLSNGESIFIIVSFLTMMFILRFIGLKYWMIYDERKIPKRRGDRLYFGESYEKACRRYDWEQK